ncbi:MAG: DUF2905 domain-containing protein [Mucilaginibacter polytrichastri]|nr:DUF2905 domain-containing protein [Mucilaginibacter polytrichastri]
MAGAGKWLIVIGGICLCAGAILVLFPGKMNWIGKLPGDIRIDRGNFRFYFPLTTLLILNLLIWLFLRIWRWLN